MAGENKNPSGNDNDFQPSAAVSSAAAAFPSKGVDDPDPTGRTTTTQEVDDPAPTGRKGGDPVPTGKPAIGPGDDTGPVSSPAPQIEQKQYARPTATSYDLSPSATVVPGDPTEPDDQPEASPKKPGTSKKQQEASSTVQSSEPSETPDGPDVRFKRTEEQLGPWKGMMRRTPADTPFSPVPSVTALARSDTSANPKLSVASVPFQRH